MCIRDRLRHSPAGAASQPIVLVDLDELESLSPREASLLAHRLPDDLRIYVGVRTRPLPVPLIGPGQQILERLTTTISPTVGALADGTPEGPASATSAVVRVDDPLETAARIAEQGRRTPDAVHVMDTVLRIAERATARAVSYTHLDVYKRQAGILARYGLVLRDGVDISDACWVFQALVIREGLERRIDPEPVSYTHLDVYKRQVPPVAALPDLESLQPVRAATPTSVTAVRVARRRSCGVELIVGLPLRRGTAARGTPRIRPKSRR